MISFTVTIKDVKVLGDDVSKVRVEYTATLNENAVIGFLGNPNTMYMEFSNNPNNEQGGDKGQTPEDKVIVFTYKVVINKIDSRRIPLAGATFKLEKVFKDYIKFSDVVKAKELHPNAVVLAHPECNKDVLEQADYIDGTVSLIKYAKEEAVKKMDLEDGDMLVITGGFPTGKSKATNFMKIEEI